MPDPVASLMAALSALPPGLVLLTAFLLPAMEASLFVGLLIPGETAVIIAGALAHTGTLSLWAVVGCAAAGAIAGDQVGFRLGRRYGPALLNRLPRWVSRHHQHERVLSFVRRRGAAAVVLGRWTASLRALVPGIAGMSGLSRSRFTAANAVGGVVWASAVAALGYLAGAGYRQVEHQLNLSAALVLPTVAVAAVIIALLRRRSRHQDDDRRSEHGVATPRAAVPTNPSRRRLPPDDRTRFGRLAKPADAAPTRARQGTQR